MKQVTAQQVVNLLNHLLEIDPEAVARLMVQVRCNQQTALNPNIPVTLDDSNKFSVNMLDVISAVFAWGRQPIIQTVHAATCQNEHAILEATKYDICLECGKMPDLHEIIRFKVNE